MPVDSETDLTGPTERDPAGVINVQISRDANVASRFVFSFLLMAGLFGAFALAKGNGIQMSALTGSLVTGFVVGLAIFACPRLVLLLWGARIRARTRDIVTRFKGRPVRDLVDGLFGAHGRVFLTTYLDTMVRVLAERGRVGVTIRSGPPELATPIDPITVTFEPRLLDEADAATVELQESLDSTTQAAGTAVTQDSRTDRLAGRRMKRNIRMAGGWLLFAIFGLQFIIAAAESIQAWSVTRHLVIASLLLSTMIFGVFRPRLSGWRAQWLAVPGGVIIRTAGLWGRKWRLHLFGRRSSVLVVHRLTRNMLRICVADAESHQKGTASPSEVVFLLRAWLSPVPPPPVEKLTDWL